LLLRLCAALLLALGLAMCIASAVLFAQWRAQASAGASGASGADDDAQRGAPWFLYCTFGAGGAPFRSVTQRCMSPAQRAAPSRGRSRGAQTQRT
jgi:hypothetical protein